MEDIYPQNERELAALCSNWQQLDILKRRMKERREGKLDKKDPDTMTRSEKKIWYKNNIAAVEEDRERVSHSNNYKQLQLLRGDGILKREDWEETRSKRLSWYRNGGSDIVDKEKYLAGMCSNWRQYHLLTRGSSSRRRQQDDDEEEEVQATRSEKLKWYRDGGKYLVEDRNQQARDSKNWVQYKLTRDARQHAERLYDAVQVNYSDFNSKEALSNYMYSLMMEGMEEREEIRSSFRRRALTETVTKTAYDYHLQPYVGVELEEASTLSKVAQLKIASFEEKLRQTTEEVMMMRTHYEQSAHEMAMQAIKEDEAAIAASRMKRKTTIVEQGQAVSTAA